MGLYHDKKEKSANYLVNLTDTEIKVYEDYSGSIWEFPPKKRIPTEALHPYGDEGGIYCVVSKSLLDRLKRYNISLDRFAIVGKKDIGRKGKIVSWLKWAKDEETPVRLRNINPQRT